MERMKYLFIIAAFVCSIITGACDGPKNDSNKKALLLLPLAALAASNITYGTLTLTVDGSTMTMYAGEPLHYDGGIAWQTYFKDQSKNDTVLFALPYPDAAAGKNYTDLPFTYASGMNMYSGMYLEGDHHFNLTITSMVDNRMQGTFSGELENYNSEIVSVTDGSFDVIYL
jgi:hypothetical protein